MAKLDRLGWAAAISGIAYGVRLGIRVTDPSALALLPPLLPPTWKARPLRIVDQLFSLVVGGADPTNPGLKRMHLAYAESLQVGRSLQQVPVLEALESFLGLGVAALSPRRVFVHAGVVAWKGQAIVLPGKSLAGKSTLVAALLRAGATYYSDEYAVLDAQGRVHPYARRLSLRVGGSEPRRRPLAAELGAATGTSALPIGLVVLSEYREGASWRPKPVTAGRAVLELLAHTVPAQLRPAEVMASLTQVVRLASTVKGTRGEAAEMVSELLGL